MLLDVLDTNLLDVLDTNMEADPHAAICGISGRC